MAPVGAAVGVAVLATGIGVGVRGCGDADDEVVEEIATPPSPRGETDVDAVRAAVEQRRTRDVPSLVESPLRWLAPSSLRRPRKVVFPGRAPSCVTTVWNQETHATCTAPDSPALVHRDLWRGFRAVVEPDVPSERMARPRLRGNGTVRTITMRGAGRMFVWTAGPGGTYALTFSGPSDQLGRILVGAGFSVVGG